MIDKSSQIVPSRFSEQEIARRKAYKCLAHSHNGISHKRCYEEENGIEERKGCIDIEAGALNADFDITLSWTIKTVNKDEFFYDHITKEDLEAGIYDARVLRTCIETMWNYDRMIGHYCSANRFDIPFLRSRYFWLTAPTRKLYVGPEFPKHGEMFVTDTYTMAKRLLKIASRRQDSIANTLQGKDIKTRIDKNHWLAIKYGTDAARKEAIKYIVDHNIKDVEQLEQNYLIMLPYVRECKTYM